MHHHLLFIGTIICILTGAKSGGVTFALINAGNTSEVRRKTVLIDTMLMISRHCGACVCVDVYFFFVFLDVFNLLLWFFVFVLLV